ncbi:MAG: tRNA (N6-threonylcarbamoyladenosine(37)-N6)-methyltransferase TrmO [Methanotrichaceae archaeon]
MFKRDHELSSYMEKITYKPIGIVHTNIKSLADAPIQAIYGEERKGQIELFPEYEEGLNDLENFSHIILIFHFHLSEGYSLLQKPFLDDTPRGVFAIRSPRRPNSIGLSIAKLEKMKGNLIDISGVDIVDSTPLLDIKPFIPKFDTRENAKTGWIKNKL